MTKEKELFNTLKKSIDTNQVLFNSAPTELDWCEFNAYMNTSNNDVSKASRDYKMI
jgi:hypothetical protein